MDVLSMKIIPSPPVLVLEAYVLPLAFHTLHLRLWIGSSVRSRREKSRHCVRPSGGVGPSANYGTPYRVGIFPMRQQTCSIFAI